MQDEKAHAAPGADFIDEASTTTRGTRAPGALNAVLLAVSVAVILGIFGFSIFQTSRVRESGVFTPPKPVTQPAMSQPADAADLQTEAPPVEEAEPVAEEPAAGEPADPETGLTNAVEPSDPAPPEEAGEAPVADLPEPDSEEYLERAWKSEASEVLGAFLASDNTPERSQWVLEPERVANILRAIESLEFTPWADLTTRDFTHTDLSLNDRRKGMFLMTRETGEDDNNTPSGRSYAFFKRTDDGLKLDLELFIQTTGKSFESFTAVPNPGTMRVFRVFITEEPGVERTESDASRSYIVAGLANFDSAIRIRVTRTSPVGRVLEAANFKSDDGERQIMRNATVELRWTDQPEHSTLELSRFLCWEFLGLGGKPMDEPVTLQW